MQHVTQILPIEKLHHFGHLDFLTRKQPYTLFLLPNRKDVHTRSSCFFREVAGHAEGIITGSKRKLPAGSSGTVKQFSLSHGHGTHAAPHGPGGQAGQAVH